MEYILLLIIIGLGVLFYLEHKKTKELIEGLKQAAKVSTYLSNQVEEEEIDEEAKERQEKIKKAFKNLMEYDYDVALKREEYEGQK